jgi:hypothetical protein
VECDYSTQQEVGGVKERGRGFSRFHAREMEKRETHLSGNG